MSTEEERVIAGVVLAGWTITPLPQISAHPATPRYWLQSPLGMPKGYYNTRYTAALAAQDDMMWWDR